MISINITGDTPREVLSELIALGMHCMMIGEDCKAAHRILEAEKHMEAKKVAAQAEIPSKVAASGNLKPSRENTPVATEPEPVLEAPQPVPEPVEVAPEPANADTDERCRLTFEDVQAALGKKSEAGHTEEIRALLKKYGANKLSRIDPANYAALLADAEAL